MIKKTLKYECNVFSVRKAYDPDNINVGVSICLQINNCSSPLPTDACFPTTLGTVQLVQARRDHTCVSAV
jgi:hypothetical protein